MTRSLRPLGLWSVCIVMFAFVAGASAQPTERFDGHKLVNVTIRSAEDLEKMRSISPDPWACVEHLGPMPYRVPPENLEALRDSGLEFEIVNQNVQDLIDAEQASIAARGPGGFDAYQNYTQVNASIDALAALRPDLAATFVVGQSLQNRAIRGIRITGAGGVAGKPAVLFNGCQHAREWIAVMVPLYIADRFVRNYDTDAAIRELLDGYVFYIVPIVNPDGYEYTWATNRLWRKNRRANADGSFGVDLNRNWAAGWGLNSGSSPTPSNDTYRGTAAFSEPESTALRDFINATPALVAHIDFHSFSQLILSPIGYVAAVPPEPVASTYLALGERIRNAILGVSGVPYRNIPAYQLYLASGTLQDWSYEARNLWAWTIELRPDENNGSTGFILPADQIIPTAQENYAAVMTLGRSLLDGVIVEWPSGQPSKVQAGASASVPLRVLPVTGSVASVTLQRRVTPGGDFVAVPLTATSATNYSAVLPPRSCGVTYDYYVEVTTAAGRVVRSPAGAPASFYSALVTNSQTIFADDCEADRGWSLSDPSDTATTGRWTRMVPQATAAQPGSDHSAVGTNCYVTDGRAGTAVGDFDVDGGATTLITPSINLGSASDPTISYWRWYSNNSGSAPNADTFVVGLSMNGGAWVTVETVGPTGSEVGGGWIQHSLRVRDLSPTLGNVRLRFVASDVGSGSIIEAAIDDLLVADSGCAAAYCSGDVNGDRNRDLTDLSTMLAAFGTCDGTAGFSWDADLDASGCVDLSDLSRELATFGQACP